MRFRIAVILGLLAASTLAQPLVPLRPHAIGGYAGPHNGVTLVGGRLAATGGGPGIFLITPATGIGWSYVSTEGDATGLSLWYLGPAVEHWFFPERMLSLSAGATAALGRASRQLHRDSAVQRTSFVCIEPTVAGRLRLFRFFGLHLGLGYRLAYPWGGTSGLRSADISGPSAFLGLSYGVYPGINTAPAERSLRIAGCWSQKLTWLRGQPVLLDGGGTRLVINRRFLAGIGGYFGTNAARVAEYEVTFGQAGLWLEYLPWPDRLITPALSTVIGIGAAGFKDAADSVQVFPAPMLDPELLLSLNLTEFLRLHIGAGYRIYFGRPTVAGWTGSDFSGPTATLGMKVGEF